MSEQGSFLSAKEGKTAHHGGSRKAFCAGSVCPPWFHEDRFDIKEDIDSGDADASEILGDALSEASKQVAWFRGVQFLPCTRLVLGTEDLRMSEVPKEGRNLTMRRRCLGA